MHVLTLITQESKISHRAVLLSQAICCEFLFITADARGAPSSAAPDFMMSSSSIRRGAGPGPCFGLELLHKKVEAVMAITGSSRKSTSIYF